MIHSSSVDSTKPELDFFIMSAPAVTAAQLASLVSFVKTLLTDKDVASLVAQLPGALVQLYQQVVLVYTASAAQQQALVVQVLQQVVAALPGLSAADVSVLDTIVTNFVPTLLTYLPQIESGLVTGFKAAEAEATTCFAWCGKLCSCCKKSS
jgi:predicted cation transporter